MHIERHRYSINARGCRLTNILRTNHIARLEFRFYFAEANSRAPFLDCGFHHDCIHFLSSYYIESLSDELWNKELLKRNRDSNLEPPLFRLPYTCRVHNKSQGTTNARTASDASVFSNVDNRFWESQNAPTRAYNLMVCCVHEAGCTHSKERAAPRRVHAFNNFEQNTHTNTTNRPRGTPNRERTPTSHAKKT